MKKAEVIATWNISLTCFCPKCDRFEDLLEHDSFWDSHEGLMPVENGTKQASNLEVICPACSHEFEVCCEY